MLNCNVYYLSCSAGREPDNHVNMINYRLKYFGVLCLLGGVVSASAQTDVLSLVNPPSTDGVFNKYSVHVTATDTGTTLSFFFRQDQNRWLFDDVSFTDDSGGGNLVVNGGFATGNLSGWDYVRPSGGVWDTGWVGGISPNPDPTNFPNDNYCWNDPATDGADGLEQTISTKIGDSYTLSFWLVNGMQDNANPSGDTFDVFVGAAVGNYYGQPYYYDSGGLVPEPAPLALSALSGLAGLAIYRRRK